MISHCFPPKSIKLGKLFGTFKLSASFILLKILKNSLQWIFQSCVLSSKKHEGGKIEQNISQFFFKRFFYRGEQKKKLQVKLDQTEKAGVEFSAKSLLDLKFAQSLVVLA